MATAGNITIGNVTGPVGLSGELSFLADNEDVGDNAANKTGLVKVGNVAVSGVTRAQVLIDLYNLASTKLYKNGDSILGRNAPGDGAGAAGGITIGSVALAAGASGSAQLNVKEYGGSVGNVAVGNVSLDAPSLALEVLNQAETGNAGNVTVGNVTLAGNDLAKAVSATSATHANFIKNVAKSGSVGSITVGKVSLNAGAGQTDALQIADEAVTNAGGVILGKVALAASRTGNVSLQVTNEAEATGGDASAGNVTVGNLSLSAASGAKFYETGYFGEYTGHFGARAVIRNSADAQGSGHNATVGNISVGNVTPTHNADTVAHTGAGNYFDVGNFAQPKSGVATNGNVSVGNVTINPAGASGAGQSNGHNFVTISNIAFATSPDGGAKVGSVTMGNFAAHTGVSGLLNLYVFNGAGGELTGDSTGRVTVGNISIDGGTNAKMYVSVGNQAIGGPHTAAGYAGGVTIGNVAMTGGKSSFAFMGDDNYGASAGTMKVGNVTLNAAYDRLALTDAAHLDNVANMSLGNVTLIGQEIPDASNLDYRNYIDHYATAGSAGTLGIGNVSLSAAIGHTLQLSITNGAADKVGALTLGNVNLAVHNTNANAAVADALLDVHTTGTSGGDIKVGNVTVAATGVSTHAKLGAANMDASFSANSERGSVTVGNIKVSGGVVGTSDHPLDNLGNLTNWLHLSSGAGRVTIGNINYSGYVGGGDADTILDVSRWAGARSIIGAQGGSTIDDNSGRNILNVSDTTKADDLYFSTTQAAVTDANVSAGTTIQSAMDEIVGFHSGDRIAFTHGTLLGGDGAIAQNGAESWAKFLSTAATDIHNGYDAYAALVSNNSYVALNSNNKVVEVVEVKGVHTFTDSNHMLHWAS